MVIDGPCGGLRSGSKTFAWDEHFLPLKQPVKEEADVPIRQRPGSAGHTGTRTTMRIGGRVFCLTSAKFRRQKGCELSLRAAVCA